MTTLIKSAILATTLVALSFTANSAPFGLTVGASLSDHTVVKMHDTNMYFITPPKPNSGFDKYIATITPKHGFCRLIVMQTDINTNVYGSSLKSRFESVQAAFKNTYGSSLDYDMLVGGSIWSDPQDFMMGLLKKERFLVSIWGADEESTLPDDITAISVTADATDSNTGIISLTYEFKNTKDCLAEEAEADKGTF